MKKTVIALAMSSCVVWLPATSLADTLVLRDGTRLEGTLEGFTSRTITFRHADGVSRRYATSHVGAVEFVSAERVNPRAASRLTVEAPVGTELVVRTVEAIDSRNAGSDQTFASIVQQDVTNAAGGMIVPEGSSAQLTIRQTSRRAAKGSPEMALDIQSLTVAGRRYLLSAAGVVPESGTPIDTGSHVAAAVNQRAALGTVIGFAGGRAATADPDDPAAQVLTKGRDVHVPAGTVITFRLDGPVSLQAER
jgi:hypothetical protein